MNTTITKPNLLTYSEEQKANLMKGYFANNVRFSKRFGSHEIISINQEKYSKLFREHIIRLFKKNGLYDGIDLENIHNYISDELRAYNFDDGVNKVSTYFYDTDDEFYEVYISYLKDVIAAIFPEDFYFQATPTIRIHCPNALNSNHYPRYHNDILYGHPAEEINIWIPITHKLDNHGFSLCSLEDSKKLLERFDYRIDHFVDNAINNKEFSNLCESLATQVDVDFGDAIMFDPRCIHSGHPMKSHSRISIDLRIILKEDYENLPVEYQGSGRRKILFVPGGCYNAKSIGEF